MSREIWDIIKESKFFYIRWYRRGAAALMFSLGLNILLMGLMYYAYIHQGKSDFYASDGIRSPILLHPLAEPNRSSTYLLPPDPPSDEKDNVAKPIPE